MRSKGVRTALLAIAVLITGLVAFVWQSYSSRFTRFPVHRLPALAMFDEWRKMRTKTDIRMATAAIESFSAHYGRLPFNSPDRDYQFSITLGHELNGVSPGLNPENAEGIVFWHVPAGEQRDGWGRLYHYHFDHDGDGYVETDHRRLRRRFVVWSDGPDGQAGTQDDIFLMTDRRTSQ